MKCFVYVLLLLLFLVYVQGYEKAVPLKDATIISGKIINGINASTGQFPWQVIINGSNGTIVEQCGGSIISNQWILTAAHCVAGFNTFQIGLGSIYLNAQSITVTTTTYVIHPNYNAVTLNHDIALIRLPITLTFDSTIRSIRLPALSQAVTTFANAVTTVSGFGRTADGSNTVPLILQWTNLRVITNAECENVFGSSTVIASTMCAVGHSSTTQSTCNGDSGGPMYLNENDTPTLIGVISFVSTIGCSIGLPSGYVRTASYLSWINSQTGIAIRP